MDFLPPFFKSKKFILAGGALTLTLYLCVLLLAFRSPARTPLPHEVAKAVLTQYQAPIKQIETGHSGSTWQLDNIGILDVRTEAEYNKQHIEGSMNVPLLDLPAARFATNHTLIVYADNVANGQKAQNILAKQKGLTVIVLTGDLNTLKNLGYKVSGT